MSILRFLRSQLLVSPPQQTFDFSNQVVVVTGGNNGLGFEAARQLLASNVARVIITVRSHEKGKRAVQELWSEAGQNERVGYQLLDMASYKSVLEFSECLAKLPRLDAVVLNAGFATTDFALVEGSESTITVNVISTMLLAANVVPILRSSANENGTLGRICVVTSDTHEFATIETEQKTDSIFDPLNKVETARMDERYTFTDIVHSNETNVFPKILRLQTPRDLRRPSHGFTSSFEPSTAAYGNLCGQPWTLSLVLDGRCRRMAATQVCHHESLARSINSGWR